MKKLCCVLLTFSLLFMLAGCSNSSPEPPKKPSPKEVVASFLDCLKNGDFAQVADYVEDPSSIEEAFADGEDSNIPALARDLFSKLTYANAAESIDGDNAEVKIDITTVAFGDIMQSVFMEAMTAVFSNMTSEEPEDEDFEAAIEKMVADKIKAADAPMNTSNATFSLKKIDSAWKISMDENDEELLNALFGGMNDFLEGFDDSDMSDAFGDMFNGFDEEE